MSYVDGFIVAVPQSRLEDYRQLAELAGAVWREHGALEYREYVADDAPMGELTSFPRSVLLKDDEIVVFSYIVHASREARDATNAKAMADARLAHMNPATMPFDGKRMIMGGFTSLVSL